MSGAAGYFRYDWQSAANAGENDHPQAVMRRLGFQVEYYEAVGIADCSILGVSNPQIEVSLPGFIERLPDYKEPH